MAISALGNTKPSQEKSRKRSLADNSPTTQREVWKLIYTQNIPDELKGRLELVIEGATPKGKESLQNVMAIEYQYAGLAGAIAYVQRLEKTRLKTVVSP